MESPFSAIRIRGRQHGLSTSKQKLDLRPKENDDERARQKREFFRKEVELLKPIDDLSSLAVNDVSCTMDDSTMQVKIVHR